MAVKAGLVTSQPQDSMISDLALPNFPASASIPESQLVNKGERPWTCQEDAKANFLAWIKEEMKKEIREATQEARESSRSLAKPLDRQGRHLNRASGSRGERAESASPSPSPTKWGRIDNPRHSREHSPLLSLYGKESEASDSSSNKEKG
ncbi:UNVERIFIED_CONTAM: hypothetical protein K2H54_074596 [Gekko kuhli]